MFGNTPQQPSYEFMVAIGNRLDTKKRNKDKHRKIPKISPGADIFQRLFMGGLIFDGLIRWEICASKSIVLAHSSKPEIKKLGVTVLLWLCFI